MCGIFGIVNYGPIDKSIPALKAEALRTLVSELLINAEIRGMSASGIAMLCGTEVSLIKAAVRGSSLPNYPSYRKVLANIKNNSFRALIGHTRAPTKGSPRNNLNNHPIVANQVIGVHNGMIANDDMLFEKYKDKITRAGEVDSEIIFRLIDMHLKDPQVSIKDAISKTAELLFGNYACAFLSLTRMKYLSLFCYHAPISYIRIPDVSLLIFASTPFIITSALGKTQFELFSRENYIMRDTDGVGAKIYLEDGHITTFDLPTKKTSNVMTCFGRYSYDILDSPQEFDDRKSSLLLSDAGKALMLPEKLNDEKPSNNWETRIGNFLRKGFLRRL